MPHPSGGGSSSGGYHSGESSSSGDYSNDEPMSSGGDPSWEDEPPQTGSEPSVPPVESTDSPEDESVPIDFSFIKELWDTITSWVTDYIDKVVPKIYLGKVIRRVGRQLVGECRYDVQLAPFDRTGRKITNVPSSLGFLLTPGDTVMVSILGNITNIIQRRTAISSTFDDGYNEATNIARGMSWTTVGTGDNYLSYDVGSQRWKLYFSDSFYDNYIARCLVAEPTGETDPETGDPVYEYYAKFRIGIARRMSQASSAYRADFMNRSMRKTSRLHYSMPEYFGMVTGTQQVPVAPDSGIGEAVLPEYVEVPVVTRVRCADQFRIPKRDCSVARVPYIDVTDIVNNSVFCDDYNHRRSRRRKPSGENFDPLKKNFERLGFWYKRFGIYIKDSHGTIIYTTPQSQAYTVRVYSLDGYRAYNKSNLIWEGGNVFALAGDPPETPYEVPPEYIIH